MRREECSTRHWSISREWATVLKSKSETSSTWCSTLSASWRRTWCCQTGSLKRTLWPDRLWLRQGPSNPALSRCAESHPQTNLMMSAFWLPRFRSDLVNTMKRGLVMPTQPLRPTWTAWRSQLNIRKLLCPWPDYIKRLATMTSALNTARDFSRSIPLTNKPLSCMPISC